MDAALLLARLAPEVAGTLRHDPATRELYAADASLYRRVPIGALVAERPDDLVAALAACRAEGVPLTMRGAGTSLAGQSVGRGLVVDTTRLSTIEIDPDARRARVGPGVVLDDLNRAAAAHGLAFGPDVATASRATLGGMIGNNSAGARSVVHGLTADAVEALDVVMTDGTRATLRRGARPPAAIAAAVPLAHSFRGPGLLRRVSGYNLDALAGEDPDWPRLIVGSEGTLAVILGAEVRLVPVPESRGLAIVPFSSVDEALRSVVDLLADGPSAIELMDAATLDPANRPPAVAALLGDVADAPATLIVEQSGPADLVARALRRIDGARVVLDPAAQARVWEVRRAGLARALRVGGGAASGPDPRPIPFVEDPAVPPGRVADFAHEARRLLAGEGVPAVWYGHASVGCLHIRPLIDLRAPGAVAMMRRIAEGVADMVVAHGGSLSGEHGDGRARSELLPRMYPPETIAAFAELKRTLDPDGILNPGIVVDPDPLDAGLRLSASPPRRPRTTAISFAAEGGLARAGEACNGNGACRAHAGVMCPSFQALDDERHSTRGRAVLLRAALEGRLDGLGDDAVHEALSLCLSCKACAAECPAGVDMARLKTESLSHRHAERGVPARARVLGATHRLLSLGSRAPALARVGAALAARGVGRAVPTPAKAWRPPPDAGDGPLHLVVADTFTTHLEPQVGDAAVAALRAAGARVAVRAPGCCGRPQLSQGLVGPARRSARRLLDRLTPAVVAGWRLVLLEPSCWSMLVDDLPTLVPDDPRARWVAEAAVPFERALLDLGVPQLRSRARGRVVVHEHCHSRALGSGDGLALARAVPGLAPVPSGAGCCGMAGAFGLEHPDVSRRIAEDRLLPALAGADLAVAAGTSCRSQVRELADVRALHPAELIAESLA